MPGSVLSSYSAPLLGCQERLKSNCFIVSFDFLLILRLPRLIYVYSNVGWIIMFMNFLTSHSLDPVLKVWYSTALVISLIALVCCKISLVIFATPYVFLHPTSFAFWFLHCSTSDFYCSVTIISVTSCSGLKQMLHYVIRSSFSLFILKFEIFIIYRFTDYIKWLFDYMIANPWF